MIVEGPSLDAAVSAVNSVGGVVTHDLGVINAAAAQLSAAQLDVLKTRKPELVIHDGPVEVARNTYGDLLDTLTNDSLVVGADRVHRLGITGHNVTVAFVDSRYLVYDELNRNDRGQNRIVANYNAITGTSSLWAQNDESGHGAHVMSLAVSSYATTGAHGLAPSGSDLTYHGIAPGVDLVSVKAFDARGQGSYANVIRGIDWVVRNRTTYNIRVLNLSFSAPPRSHYREDPLNRAVMTAWKAGIVVVASAGTQAPSR